MYMPKPAAGGDFTPAPAGTHTAVCFRVIDLGTQQVTFQGESKLQHKIRIDWELPEEKMTDGRPFTIGAKYTFSSSEKAILRQHLEAWRGKPFVEADFGPGGFDIRNIIGKGCLLNVIHKPSDDGQKIYAQVKGVMALPKGMKVEPPQNAQLFFSLAEFNQGVFNQLPQYFQDEIKKSPEYHEAQMRLTGHAANLDATENGHPALDDSIPF